jgi:hypothetical protein
VLELPPDRHAEFLDNACATDSAMRVELESLLLAGDRVPPGFLESTPWDQIDFAAGALQPGQTFARFFQRHGPGLARRRGRLEEARTSLTAIIADQRPIATTVRALLADQS